MMKKTVLAFAASAAAGALLASPSVMNVSLEQNAATRVVTVTYSLGAEPAIVTADFRTNDVSIGGASMRRVAGDVNRLVTNVSSVCSFTWLPDREWADRVIDDGSVKAVIRVWATNCPPDLRKPRLRA